MKFKVTLTETKTWEFVVDAPGVEIKPRCLSDCDGEQYVGTGLRGPTYDMV